MTTLPPVKDMAQNIAEPDVLITINPQLTEKDQLQPEEQHPQFLREATRGNLEKLCCDYQKNVADVLSVSQ
ncbi:hypothetical protein SRHO_G00298980 [Serrasalmus rhombeus]